MEDPDSKVGFWMAGVLFALLAVAGLWVVYQFYKSAKPTKCTFQCKVPTPNSNTRVILKSTRTGLAEETKVIPDENGKAIVEITEGKCANYEAEFENMPCQSLSPQQPATNAP